MPRIDLLARNRGGRFLGKWFTPAEESSTAFPRRSRRGTSRPGSPPRRRCSRPCAPPGRGRSRGGSSRSPTTPTACPALSSWVHSRSSPRARACSPWTSRCPTRTSTRPRRWSRAILRDRFRRRSLRSPHGTRGPQGGGGVNRDQIGRLAARVAGSAGPGPRTRTRGRQDGDPGRGRLRDHVARRRDPPRTPRRRRRAGAPRPAAGPGDPLMCGICGIVASTGHRTSTCCAG